MTEISETVAIQFIKGENEKENPEIRLFRDCDGKKGKAVYKFFNPTSITLENFESIKKMYLIDEEGELLIKKIDLFISENLIKEVTSTYSWNSEKEFERFMRFSKRYANSLTRN
ncbi:photosystem II reaction center protein Psb28 [Prochlorococcus sp. MIT 0916]|uniref:photosystem II reaction center protein Psb28 n=1 Tax=Prochlorococcus sp. MIT 0916 TaxID=3082521 RepID=UPI0039B3E88C